MPCVGVLGTEENGNKDKWQWGGRRVHQYVVILQCTEVHCALPVTKGINLKSGKLTF